MTNLKIKTIAGNWKMSQSKDSLELFFDQFSKQKGNIKSNVNITLFPTLIQLPLAVSKIKSLNLDIKVGAQNAHSKLSGAFTGEVSGPQLLEYGINQVLIGHSERRQFFGETDASAAQKVISLLDQGFKVMYCLGETLEDRNAGKINEVLKNSLVEIKNSDRCKQAAAGHNLMLAYEPVWAIGTGLTATLEQADQVHQWIKEFIGFPIEVLYGGSVTPQNAKELLDSQLIDGVLVGGDSLKFETFYQIIQCAHNGPLNLP